MLWLCILVRVVANPFSNVFQKHLTAKAVEPLCIICVTHALLSLVCLPLLLFVPPPLTAEFWLNISICSLLAVAGNVLIVWALKLSDLSLVGPINAYKPVVSLLPGVLLLGEVPRPAGLVGMGLIVVGSYFLVDKNVGRPGENVFLRFFFDRGVQVRIAALVLSATEAVFLKKALLASSPLIAFAVWSVLGFAVALVAAVPFLRGGKLGQGAGVAWSNRPTWVALANTTGLMQLCTLITLQGFQVGYALALFQTSAILSVLLGYKVFQEGHFVERLIGSAIMVAGAMLIVVSR